MPSDHVEVERKYEVPADVRLPDLTGLPRVRFVAAGREVELEATYYDTPGFALLDAGITMRRRTGGSDAGWTLKLPRGGDERTELTAPLGEVDEDVPVALTDRVRAWTRRDVVRPIATLTTRRVDRRLLGIGEKVLAICSDDQVTAHATADGGVRLSNWREWELELVDGPHKLLGAATDLFTSAGARPSEWSSKVHRSLGRESSHRGGTPPLGPKSTAGDVLSAYLAEQVHVIFGRDHSVRAGDADSVHKTRVATRRLRSAMATFRPLLDRAVTDPIRDELAWYAAALGHARDAEVQREHLLAAIAAEPDELVLDPVAARIKVELQSELRTAHDQLLEIMDDDRYFRLLDTLQELGTAPALTKAARGRAAVELAAGVRKATRHLYSLVKSGPSAQPRDQWLHDIRKAAKRVRYAAETAAPALGKPSSALAAAAEEIQTLLGDHQDSVVLRNTLRAIGIRMHLDGENAFTLGRLHALQETRADRAEAEFVRAWSHRYSEHLRAWRHR